MSHSPLNPDIIVSSHELATHAKKKYHQKIQFVFRMCPNLLINCEYDCTVHAPHNECI